MMYADHQAAQCDRSFHNAWRLPGRGGWVFALRDEQRPHARDGPHGQRVLRIYMLRENVNVSLQVAKLQGLYHRDSDAGAHIAH